MNHRVKQARHRTGPRKRGRVCQGCGRIGKGKLFGSRWENQKRYTRLWCLDCRPLYTVAPGEMES